MVHPSFCIRKVFDIFKSFVLKQFFIISLNHIFVWCGVNTCLSFIWRYKLSDTLANIDCDGTSPSFRASVAGLLQKSTVSFVAAFMVGLSFMSSMVSNADIPLTTQSLKGLNIYQAKVNGQDLKLENENYSYKN